MTAMTINKKSVFFLLMLSLVIFVGVKFFKSEFDHSNVTVEKVSNLPVSDEIDLQQSIFDTKLMEYRTKLLGQEVKIAYYETEILRLKNIIDFMTINRNEKTNVSNLQIESIENPVIADNSLPLNMYHELTAEEMLIAKNTIDLVFSQAHLNNSKNRDTQMPLQGFISQAHENNHENSLDIRYKEIMENKDALFSKKNSEDFEYNDNKKELITLKEQEEALKIEVGEDEYDKKLIVFGVPNRIAVQHMSYYSPAKIAGLKPGDIVLSYGGKRIFNESDFNSMEIEKNEQNEIRLEISRNGELTEIYVPEGPLGVVFSGVLHDPSSVTDTSG